MAESGRIVEDAENGYGSKRIQPFTSPSGTAGYFSVPAILMFVLSFLFFFLSNLRCSCRDNLDRNGSGKKQNQTTFSGILGLRELFSLKVGIFLPNHLYVIKKIHH